MQNIDIEAINAQIRIDSAFLEDLKRETQKVIVGQEQMIDRLLLGLLTNGHVLLEGLPGLAKTMAIKALSKAINSKFRSLVIIGKTSLKLCFNKSVKLRHV